MKNGLALTWTMIRMQVTDVNWQLARSYFKQQEISDEMLQKIAEASESLEVFQLVIKECYREAQTHPDRARPFKTLINYCDNSIYSLKEWITTYHYFFQYLQKNGRHENFLMMLGYMQCSAVSPENKDIKHDFKDILEAMLETYGFTGKN